MISTKRLSVVHTESSCGWGGQEIRVLTEAQGLRARGHHVTLVCPPEAPVRDAAVKMNLATVALPIARKNLTALLALRNWLRHDKDIDLINTHSSTDSWLVALARLTLPDPAPVVRTRHVSTTIRNNAPTRWLYTKATSYIVTTGEALKQQLIRENLFDGTQITSVPTGIDLERFRPRDSRVARTQLGLDVSRNYIGIVATLRNWKGHTYLLQAFAAIAPRYPSWDLILVGDGPQRQNLERQIAALGLAGRIKMVGNRDDVERWFNAFDIFVLPSYGEEGVSQSVIQAMASELPVISTTVGALAEAVMHEKTGVLIEPRDSAPLEKALIRMIDDPELRRRFGAAGYRRATTHFGQELMLDAMEEVFRRVAANRKLCAA